MDDQIEHIDESIERLRQWLIRQIRRLRRKIDLRIEPHPIGEHDFHAQNPFAWEVAHTGIEIEVQ